MPRLPRRPGPGRAVGAVSASLARRRAARAPRVVVKDRDGRARTLAAEDAAAEALVRAARELLAAAAG